MKWGPVEPCKNRSGNIVNYRIKYQPTGGGSSSVKNMDDVGEGSVGGQLLLEGLTSFTDYSIRVAAVNNQSDVGVFSDALTAQTREYCIEYTV